MFSKKDPFSAKNNPMAIAPEFVHDFSVNGLHGRKLVYPANNPKNKTNKDIVMFYGQHGSLERMKAVAEFLRDYGTVTMYDMPGFGGMTSFYDIGKDVTLDNYADYMCSLLRAHQKPHDKQVIVPMSLSCIFVTYALQKYPELQKQTGEVVCFVGWGGYQDFAFSPRRRSLFRVITRIASNRFVNRIGKMLILNPLVLTLMMDLFLRHNPKLRELSAQKQRDAAKFEKHLWKINDLRTQMATNYLLLTENLVGRGTVTNTMYELAAENDQYFKPGATEASLRKIFDNYTPVSAQLQVHAPTIIADTDEVAEIIPTPLIDAVLKKP